MNGTKLYLKVPIWIIVVYILMLFFEILGIIDIMNIYKTKNEIRDVLQVPDIIFTGVFFLMVLFFMFLIIKINFSKKMFFEIDNNGIKYDEYISKKYIKWDDELYYFVTNSFFKSYSIKNMLPLTDKMYNQNNIKNGYISIKTKKAIKIMRNNKGWICISTRFLGNNMQIDEIIKIINEYRGFRE